MRAQYDFYRPAESSSTAASGRRQSDTGIWQPPPLQDLLQSVQRFLGVYCIKELDIVNLLDSAGALGLWLALLTFRDLHPLLPASPACRSPVRTNQLCLAHSTGLYEREGKPPDEVARDWLLRVYTAAATVVLECAPRLALAIQECRIARAKCDVV